MAGFGGMAGLGDKLKKLGVTDDQVSKAEGLLGSNSALVGKAESFLGGEKPANATGAPGAGAVGTGESPAPGLNAAPGPVDPPAAATATVAAAAAAVQGEGAPAGGAPPGAGSAIHKYAAQAGISSNVVDQGLAAIEKIPEPQLKAAAAKLGVSGSVVDQGLSALGIGKKSTPPATPTPNPSSPAAGTGGPPTAGATPPAEVAGTAGLEQTHPVADSGVTDALKAPMIPDSTGAPGGVSGSTNNASAKPAADDTAEKIAAKLPGGLGDNATVKNMLGKGMSLFGK